MNKKKIIISIIILIVFLLVGIIIVNTVSNKDTKENNQNLSKNDLNEKGSTNATIEPPKEKLYRVNKNKQVYIDEKNNVFDLDKSIDGSILYSDFTYGTGLVKKDNKTAIVDYNGEIIVGYDEYDSISASGKAYIATSFEKNEAHLLDMNGKTIEGTKYDEIQELSSEPYGSEEGLFISVNNNLESPKYGIITCTGAIISNCKYEDGQEIYCNGEIVKAGEDIYIIDKEKYELIYSFKSSEVAVGSTYVVDLENKEVYVYGVETRDVIKITDCEIKEDETWNTYNALYNGCNINNYLDTYGYCVYKNSNGKYNVIYKDGTIVVNNVEQSNEYNSYFGRDYLFIQNDNNIDVYNGNKKIKTIENAYVDPNYTVLKYNELGNNEIVPVKNHENSNYFLYNPKGELINNNEYKKQNSSTVFESVDGNSRIRMIPNGKFIDAKDYFSVQLLYDECLAEYSNKYFIADKELNKSEYYLLDENSNELVKIGDSKSTKLYGNEEFIIFNNFKEDSLYHVYYLNTKTEIFNKEEKIEYISDFDIFVSSKAVYSRDGNILFEI